MIGRLINMKWLMEWKLLRETKILEKKPAIEPLCPPPIPYGLGSNMDSPQVRSRQLIAPSYANFSADKVD
jgi:hypothetical protein